MNCNLHDSIPDWIIEHPETSIVFDRLGLDTSCGGKSLEYICLQNSLDVQDVLRQLKEALHPPTT